MRKLLGKTHLWVDSPEGVAFPSEQCWIHSWGRMAFPRSGWKLLRSPRMAPRSRDPCAFCPLGSLRSAALSPWGRILSRCLTLVSLNLSRFCPRPLLICPGKGHGRILQWRPSGKKIPGNQRRPHHRAHGRAGLLSKGILESQNLLPWPTPVCSQAISSSRWSHTLWAATTGKFCQDTVPAAS